MLYMMKHLITLEPHTQSSPSKLKPSLNQVPGEYKHTQNPKREAFKKGPTVEPVR